MKNYIDRIANIGTTEEPGFLLAAWKNLYHTANPHQRKFTRGMDNESLEDIRKHDLVVLKRISSQLKSTEGYIFSGLKPVLVKKDNGKNRVVCIPTCRDRIVQKAIQTAIINSRSRYTDFNTIYYGFIKHYGVQNAIARALEIRTQHPFVYKTDISAFFDNIDRIRMKAEIKKKIRISSLYDLIARAIDMEIWTEDKNVKKKILEAGIHAGRGVRQGMPLSPLFANLYLSNLDLKIREKQYSAVRYADDIIICTDSEKECHSVHAFMAKELEKISLHIPSIEEKKKTKIYNPKQVVEFLGIGIQKEGEKYISVITSEQRQEVKNNIFRFADFQYLNARQINFPKLALVLRSTINGYLGVYGECSDYSTFSNQLSQWSKSAVRDLLKKNYRIDINELDNVHRSFLIGSLLE